MNVLAARSIAVLLVVAACVPTATAADAPPTVSAASIEAALAEAGANRAELEKAIAAVDARGDAEKSAAVRFLVANMPGKGYVVFEWRDAKGEKVAFDSLSFPDFARASAAFDLLEKERGKVDYAKAEFRKDLETVRADFLVEHVDRAFEAWRSTPARARVGFATFLEYVLPYRGSEEPVEAWFGPVRERYRKAAEGDARPDDAALYAALGRDVAARVRFDERYYLHPTDQGFAEMSASGMGRCEDITNMTTYAARSVALATAADYTPAWGHRDNNHAWNVLLDANGRGSDPSNAHAAKVYRKTFSIQRDSLSFRLAKGEEPANRWLGSKAFVDVTDQYGATTDVDVALDAGAVAGRKIAYLCVFNGGEWVAIHWAEVAGGRAVFAKMGRNLCYLPAVHDGKALVPAAAPLLVSKDGAVTVLAGTSAPTALVAVAVSPARTSPDTKVTTPVSRLSAGTTYVLSKWTASGWASVAESKAGAEPLGFAALAGDGLYWLVAKESDRLERIFTVSDGRQRFW